MGDYDITQTTTSSMTGGVNDFSVGQMSTSGAYVENTFYDNPDFQKWYANYRKIDKIKKAIDAWATWVLGQGWEAESDLDQVTLENIRGSGEDDFNDILWNMLVIKKVNGDSYAQIIRNSKGTLINVKPLSPRRVRVKYNEFGMIDEYEYLANDLRQVMKTLQPYEMLHLINNRVADEIHGISDVECVEWIAETQQEALRDWRRIQHRSTIRIIEVDIDDTAKLTQMKADYKEAVKKGEVLFIPRQTGEVNQLTAPDSSSILNWIRYLDDAFYMAIGVPKVILGGETSSSEGGAKVAYMTFEPLYRREVKELEADLFSQLGIRIVFGPQPTIAPNMQQNQSKNTSQTSMQPKDGQATMTRE